MEERNQVTVCEFIEGELQVIKQLYAHQYHQEMLALQQQQQELLLEQQQQQQA